MKLMMSGLTAMLTATVAMVVGAEQGVFDEYRAMMGDDNPAIFVIDEGEEYWFEPAGPNQVTFEQCDLGLGAGVVEGGLCAVAALFL